MAHYGLHTQMPATLTARQELFVNHYLIDFNATAAAIRAGYSKKTAQEQGSRLLNHPAVAAAVDAARTKAVEKAEITVQKVLSDLEDMRKGALECKQFSPAVRASELQGKYLKMFFDGHAVEATGLRAMSEAELIQNLHELMATSVVHNVLATKNYL